MTAINDKSEFHGILLKILSVLAFSIMGGLIKYLDGTIPLGQLVFFRSSVALIPLVMFLIWTSDFPSGLATKHPFKHIVRCLLGTFAMFCSFKALSYLPLAEHTALFYLSPIFLVVFSMIFLKEQVSRQRWLGVALGVAGLAVLTFPKFTLDLSAESITLIGVVLAVMSAVFAASALLQVRQLTQMGENAGAIAFYFAMTSTTVGVVAMVANYTMLDSYVTPELWQWVCLFAIGVMGGVAQIMMTLAFKYAEASALAPFDYLAIVFSVGIGFVVFAEVPDMLFWFAMPLILTGAMIARKGR